MLILIFAAQDLCEVEKHDCEQICVNTPGSYVCQCYDGYELEENGKKCFSMYMLSIVLIKMKETVLIIITVLGFLFEITLINILLTQANHTVNNNVVWRQSIYLLLSWGYINHLGEIFIPAGNIRNRLECVDFN